MARKVAAKKDRKKRKLTAAAGPMAPTPERLAKAAGAVRQDAVRAYHCEDAPVDRLAARCHLAPDDPARNEVLRQAAQRFYEHWYLGGMSPIAAIELGKASASSEARPAGMPATETALMHRRKWRDAVAALADAGAAMLRADCYFEIVASVVLEEIGVEAIAQRVTPYRDRGKAIAVTLDRLRAGLGVLAVHFQIGGLDRVRTRKGYSWHESGLRPEGAQDRRSRIRATELRDAEPEPDAPRSATMRRHRSLAGM